MKTLRPARRPRRNVPVIRARITKGRQTFDHATGDLLNAAQHIAGRLQAHIDGMRDGEAIEVCIERVLLTRGEARTEIAAANPTDGR